METSLYLIKVNLYWILFYSIYWLLLRQLTFFKLNRFYLMTSLVISLLLPSIEVNPTDSDIPQIVNNATERVASILIDSPPDTNVNWILVLKGMYLCSVLYMFFNLLKGIYHITLLINRGESIPLDGHTLILLPKNQSHNESIGSFSFFKWLVVSHQDYEHCFETILHHESIHIKQWHSMDVLLAEMVKVFFWFNPVLWLYKFSIQQVHEYLADTQALNREEYTNFLISYARKASIESIANQFYHSSFLKNRIQMLYKKRTSPWQLSKYLLVIPLIGFVVLTTSGTEPLTTLNDISTSVESLTKSQKKQNKSRNDSNQVTTEVRKSTPKKRKSSKSNSKYQQLSVVSDTIQETAPSDKNSGYVFRKTNFNLRPSLDTTLGSSVKKSAVSSSKYRYPALLPSSPVRLIQSTNNP